MTRVSSVLALLLMPGCLTYPDLSVQVFNETDQEFSGTVAVRFDNGSPVLDETHRVRVPAHSSHVVLELRQLTGTGTMVARLDGDDGRSINLTRPDWNASSRPYIYFKIEDSRLRIATPVP